MNVVSKLTLGILSIFLIQSTFALETVEGAKKDIATFKQEMSIKLQEAENNLKALRDRAALKKDDMSQKAAAEYEETRKQLSHDLDRLQADAKGEWKSAKQKLSSSISNLNKKVQSALKE